MKTKYILFFGFWLALFAISCNRDDFNFEVPTQKLSFSEDTLVLDTVYNQVRSETYAVKFITTKTKTSVSQEFIWKVVQHRNTELM